MKSGSAPFGTNPDEAMFFAEPGAMRCVDLVRHLAQFSDLLPIVTGPKGSGKTTLLHELRRQTADTWRVGYLDGAVISSPELLLDALAAAFDVTTGLKATDLINRLLNHWVFEEGSGQTPVVLVDDAHEMAPDALEMLLHLSDTLKDTLAQVRIVLFGDTGLTKWIKNQALRDPSEAVLLHAQEVPALDEEQTAAYLAFRLTVTGYTGESPFSATEVRDIYEASGGLPGLINEQADIRLAGNLTPKLKPERRPAENPSGKPPLRSRIRRADMVRWVGAAVLLVAVLAGINLRDDFADWFSVDTDESIVARDEPLPTEIPPLAQAPEEPEPLVSQPPDREGASEPEPEPELEPLTKPVEPAPAEGKPIPAPVPVKPPAVVQPRIVARIAESEPPVTDTPEGAGVRGADWLLAQNPDHHTVQLLASRTETALLAYIERHKLGDEVAYYQKLRDDEPWYSLLYGAFPDIESAKAAAAELPAAIRPKQPWVRSIATVQAEIRQ